uniref:Uncharacterized protein n=1 Tax=Oryza glumipatula TaxID=40148 RepID=A0A0E0BKA2_9ORYZ
MDSSVGSAGRMMEEVANEGSDVLGERKGLNMLQNALVQADIDEASSKKMRSARLCKKSTSIAAEACLVYQTLPGIRYLGCYQALDLT